MEFGVVRGLHRRQDDAQIGELTLVDWVQNPGSEHAINLQAVLVGEEPSPLGWAAFEGGPSWYCLGPVGGMDAICREHFLAGDKTNITATGSTTYDTNWEAIINGAGSLINTPNNIGTLGFEANGLARLTSGPGASRYSTLRKKTGTTPVFLSHLAWVRAKVRLPSVSGATVNVGVGAGDDIGSGGGFTVVIGSGLFGLNATGAPTTPASGIIPADGTDYYIDLVAAADQIAAMWINGDGPWWTTTTIDFTDDIHLGITLESDGANTKDCYVDYLHLDQVAAWDASILDEQLEDE